MSNLKNLVPPLELCKLIPAGELEDSYFVWAKFDEWVILLRDCVEKNKAYITENVIHPAPTLQEIMEAIGGIKEEFVPDPLSPDNEKLIKRNPQYQPSIEFFPEANFPWTSMRWTNSIWSESDTSAPEAAIRTYLKVKGVKVTMPCVECGTWLQHLGDDQYTEEFFDNIRVPVTEVCPKCGYKYYDGFLLHIFQDIEKHLIWVNTPMGSRWIKKLSNPSDLSDLSDKNKKR